MLNAIENLKYHTTYFEGYTQSLLPILHHIVIYFKLFHGNYIPLRENNFPYCTYSITQNQTRQEVGNTKCVESSLI